MRSRSGERGLRLSASLATAACAAGKDPEKIVRMPDTHGMKNEVIIQKSHRNGSVASAKWAAQFGETY